MYQNELELLSQVIGSLYEMAADPQQWAVLDTLVPTAVVARIAAEGVGRVSSRPDYPTAMTPTAMTLPDALIQPHIERARLLSAQLARHQFDRLLQEPTLDAISVGAIITDISARPLYTTRVADQLLREDGLLVREGRLETIAPRSTHKLLQQIEQVAIPALCGATPAQKYLSIRAADGTALQLYITAVPEAVRVLRFNDACALIYCHDARAPLRPLADVLEHLFHLTRAESQVAEALLHGRSLQSYAEQRRISIHTVKNQLKSIFEKTGHASQTAFVHSVLTNPLVAVASLFTKPGSV